MTTLDQFLPDLCDSVGGGELQILRLSETPALVAVFTDKVGSSSTHYVDLPNLRSELRCKGAIHFIRLTRRSLL